MGLIVIPAKAGMTVETKSGTGILSLHKCRGGSSIPLRATTVIAGQSAPQSGR